MVACTAGSHIPHRCWGAMGSVYLRVYGARAWTRGGGRTGVKYSQRGAKGKKSKTSSGPREGLQQERKECAVLCDCAGFSSVCFSGVIVLKSPETLS